MFRWIAYESDDRFPGVPMLKRFASLVSASDSLRETRETMGTDRVSSLLYAYSDDAWESAKDFEEVGIPFDYPDRRLSIGPRGGVKIEKC